MPVLPECPLRTMSSPMFVFPSRWGRLRETNNGADCFETALLPNFFAALGFRSVCVKKRRWEQIGEASPRATARLEVRMSGSPDVFRMGSELRRINNQGEAADVARGRIGSP